VSGTYPVELPDESATERLGETIAMMLRPGDLVALSGELGAGKTTLARALLRSFSGRPSLEVPSPTFTLVQPYAGVGFRFPVTHVDLYRVADPREIDELGLDDALAEGALVVEWPEHGGRFFANAMRFDISLAHAGAGRLGTLSASDPKAAKRLARALRLRAFLDRTNFAAWRRRYYQGDASWRGYETLHGANGAVAVLMNADAMPDKEAPAAREAYMSATHLVAYADVAPVVAIAAELERRGVSVPRVLAADVTDCAVVMEDLGTTYVQEGGAPIPERYRAALDLLVHLHRQDWPNTFHGPAGARCEIPRYSRVALGAEVAILIDKFLPAMTGQATSADVRDGFIAAWDGPFRVIEERVRTLTLFDYHSPNLHWLPERQGIARVGVIDTQDARFSPAAYDVVSLTQDARVSVPPALEDELLQRYLAARRSDGPFDEASFRVDYSICGAQRATRILGVFARLASDDGKAHYLQHVPRLNAYLDRCLEHPVLSSVKAWYDANAPRSARDAFAARR
jgi:tRNA threonylcarbamoyl adenosine modification protein YjeE